MHHIKQDCYPILEALELELATFNKNDNYNVYKSGIIEHSLSLVKNVALYSKLFLKNEGFDEIFPEMTALWNRKLIEALAILINIKRREDEFGYETIFLFLDNNRLRNLNKSNYGWGDSSVQKRISDVNLEFISAIDRCPYLFNGQQLNHKKIIDYAIKEERWFQCLNGGNYYGAYSSDSTKIHGFGLRIVLDENDDNRIYQLIIGARMLLFYIILIQDGEHSADQILLHDNLIQQNHNMFWKEIDIGTTVIDTRVSHKREGQILKQEISQTTLLYEVKWEDGTREDKLPPIVFG